MVSSKFDGFGMFLLQIVENVQSSPVAPDVVLLKSHVVDV